MAASRKVIGGTRRKLRNYGVLGAAAVMAVCHLSPQSAHAATFTTWLGTTNTVWGTNTNWSGSVLPSSTVVAEFNTTFSNQPALGASATAEGIWATTGLGQDVTISGGNTLTLTGDATFGATSHTTAGIVLDDTANHNLTISSTSITLNNSQSFWVDNAATLTLAAVNLNTKTLTLSGGNASGKIVFGGIISGTTGSLVINTSGTVTLGVANSFTGGVTLNTGSTLILNAAGALGAAAGGQFIINGGTIDQTGTAVALTNRTPNGTTIAGNFTFTGTDNLNMGTAAITNAGDRTITLNGTSMTLTMGGVMTNSEGTLQTTTVNGAGNTFSIGGYALSNGSNFIDVINGTGNVTITGAVTNGTSTASGLTYSGSGTLNLSGANTFGGLLTVSSGTVTVSGASTGTGGVTVTTGTLNINAVGAAGNGPLGNGGTLTINGGTIDNTSTAAKVLLNVNPITIGGSFAFSTSAGTASNNLTLPGAVSLAADQTITLNGTGTLTLSGLLTNTSNSIRTLTVNNGAGTSSASLLSIGSYALSNSASNLIDVINGTANVTITGAVTNGASTASGLTYSGSGTLTLANTLTTSTYTGATSVTGGGTLAIGSNNGLGGSTSIYLNNGTLTTTASLSLASTRTLFLGPTTGNGSGTLAPSVNHTLTIAGVIQDNPSGTNDGLDIISGTVSLISTSTNNTFSGAVTMSGSGNLSVTNDAALGNTTLISVSGSGSFQGGATIGATRTFSLGVGASDAGLFTNSGTIQGVVQDNIPSGVNQTHNIFNISSGQKIAALSNAGNTYSGGTQIWQTAVQANGIVGLQINADGDLGAVPSSPMANISLHGAGSLIATTSMTLNSNRGITLGLGYANGLTSSTTPFYGGTILVNSSASNILTYNGVISDEVPGQPAMLTYGQNASSSYQGGVIIGGLSTYSGGTNISEGLVQMSIDDGATAGSPGPWGVVPSSPTPGNIILGYGGTYYAGALGVAASAPTTVTLNSNRGIAIPSTGSPYATIVVASSHTLNYAGLIAGGDATAVLAFTGAGNANFSGNSAITLLQILQGGYTGSPGTSGGTTTLSGTLTITNTTAGTQTTPTVTVSTTGGSAGTLILTGSNTFSNTPTFNVTGGALLINGEAALGGSGSVPAGPTNQIFLGNSNANNSTGTLQATSSFALAANRGIGIGGTVETNTTGGGTIDVTGSNTLMVNGAIQGLGSGFPSLTKSDTGTLVLAGANTYAGNTNVTGGTVILGNATAVPFNPLVVPNNSAGTVGKTTVSGSSTLDISGQTLTNSITLNSGSLTNSNGSLGTVTGNLSGVGYTVATNYSSAPTLTFTGTATAVATLGVATAGVTGIVGGSGYVAASTVVTISGGGGTGATATATVASGVVTAIAITNPGTGFTSAPTIAISGVGSGASASYNPNDFQIGSTQITSPGSGTGFSASGGGGTATFTPVLSGITLTGTSNSIGGNNGNIEIDGVISGAGGGFAKFGSNIVTLTAANTYTGATTVGGGKLTVGSTGKINNSSGVSINGGEFNYNSSTPITAPITFGASGGTLSGTGTISTPVTGNGLAIISPGNSPAIQTYTAGLTFNSGDTYKWEHTAGNAVGTAGTDFDQIVIASDAGHITSGLSIDPAALLSLNFAASTDFTDPFWSSNEVWTIAAYTSGAATSGTFANSNIFISGTTGILTNSPNTLSQGTFSTSIDGGNNLLLDWTPTATSVPEPASLALLGLGALGLLSRRRRR